MAAIALRRDCRVKAATEFLRESREAMKSRQQTSPGTSEKRNLFFGRLLARLPSPADLSSDSAPLKCCHLCSWSFVDARITEIVQFLCEGVLALPVIQTAGTEQSHLSSHRRESLLQDCFDRHDSCYNNKCDQVK